MRHATPVVFPVDFNGGKHVYRVHPINVQLVTDPNPRRNMDVILVQKVWINTGQNERRDQSFTVGESAERKDP